MNFNSNVNCNIVMNRDVNTFEYPNIPYGSAKNSLFQNKLKGF